MNGPAEPADRTAAQPPPPPPPAYELEWEPRAQQTRRKSRLSRLFPTGGASAHYGAPAEPEAPAAAPPPQPPRAASFQRKALPVGAAVPAAAVPKPDVPSASDDGDPEAALGKEEAQRQPLGGGAPALASSNSAHYHNDAPADHAPGSASRSSRRARLDAAMPPHRKYCGMRRRVFLIVLAVVLVLVLALIIGLAVGLSARDRSQRDLPLPGRDGGKTHEGELTFYAPGLGACGSSHGSGDMIAAVARSVYDAAAKQGDGNPNNNPLCGKKIRVERGGESVEVAVVDRCEGCQPTDLDLSPSAFQRLAREEDGRVVGQWKWL